MIIGIDATNIKSDGGLVHLFELLNNFSFKNSKINKIIIWGNSESLNKIKENKNINKINIKNISNNPIYRPFGNFTFYLRNSNFTIVTFICFRGVLLRKVLRQFLYFRIFYLLLMRT